MSDIKETVNEGIKAAMKAKDKTRLNVLRYLKKLFIENDTSGKAKPEMDIVIAHAKKTKDSLDMYPEGTPQREEILREIAILDEFLPKQMDASEVQALIDEIKAKQDSPNMGTIMKELQPQIKGRFDGKLASQMVKDSVYVFKV